MVKVRGFWPFSRAEKVSAQVDEARIRRIGWRLAATTGLTISALLGVLGVAVYETTQSAFFEQMKSAVIGQAQSEASPQSGEPPPGSPGAGGQAPYSGHQAPPKEIGRVPVTDDVYVSVIKPDMKCSASSPGGPGGIEGTRIPDLKAAREALRTGNPELATFIYQGTPYLVYSEPVFRPPPPTSRGVVEILPRSLSTETGVVQASISEQPYRDDVSSLLEVLLLIGGLGLAASLAITGLVVQRALLPIRSSIRHQRDFVADAAHELRTPISIIKTAGEMMLRNGAEAKREEMARIALDEANHLTRLVADLSLLARSDTGTLDFARDDVDLSMLVREIAADVDVLAEDRDITLILRATDDIHLTGDRMRLRQVVLILVDNALKHTPTGGEVTITLDRMKRKCLLQVTDSGTGIAPEDLNHVFDRFFRAMVSRTEDGSGLGLSIAESIVRAHRGDIAAENRAKGQGAVFTISLPLAGPDGLEKDAADRTRSLAGQA